MVARPPDRQWQLLLAASPDLADRPVKQIIDLYRRRMQIAEGSRDVKSH